MPKPIPEPKESDSISDEQLIKAFEKAGISKENYWRKRDMQIARAAIDAYIEIDYELNERVDEAFEKGEFNAKT